MEGICGIGPGGIAPGGIAPGGIGGMSPGGGRGIPPGALVGMLGTILGIEMVVQMFMYTQI